MTFLERYLAAVEKCYVQCLNDPEEEPYRSKYESRKSFEELREVDIDEESDLIQREFETLDLVQNENKLKFITTTSAEETSGQVAGDVHRSSVVVSVSKKHRFLIRLLLDYHIATIYSDTEERSEGEARLRDILVSIESGLPHPLLSALALNLLNQLVLIRTSYEQYNDAIELAQRTEKVYQSSSPPLEPYRLRELIQIDSATSNGERREEFEQTYTHTLFYLAQIYAKLHEKDQSAMYCRLTLERQLTLFHQKSAHFDALDWATNCATLSQYYMSNHDYATARHCMMCADLMLDHVHLSPSEPVDEKLAERTASFKRCWVKYAVNLLSKID